eukprot:6188172-Pleurochrysis_carterae.AAC.5
MSSPFRSTAVPPILLCSTLIVMAAEGSDATPASWATEETMGAAQARCGIRFHTVQGASTIFHATLASLCLKDLHQAQSRLVC